MKTVTECIRERLESGLHRNAPLDELRRTEWSREYEQVRRNRMIMGSMRYERMEAKQEGHNYDFLKSIEKRVQQYREDGNLEHMADIGNCAMLEFCYPTHPRPKWEPVDDGEHVGRR